MYQLLGVSSFKKWLSKSTANFSDIEILLPYILGVNILLQG